LALVAICEVAQNWYSKASGKTLNNWCTSASCLVLLATCLAHF